MRIRLLEEMVRKVTEISLAWQGKAVQTASRLRSAEQGVEDVLEGGVGTGSRAALVGGSGRTGEVRVTRQHHAGPLVPPASPQSVGVLAAVCCPCPGGALCCGQIENKTQRGTRVLGGVRGGVRLARLELLQETKAVSWFLRELFIIRINR